MDSLLKNLVFIFSLAKTILRNNPHYTLIWIFIIYTRRRFERLTNNHIHIQSVPDKTLEQLLKKCGGKSRNYIDYKSCAFGMLEGMKEDTIPVTYYVCSKITHKKYKLLIVPYASFENEKIVVSETMIFNLENTLHHKLGDASYFVLPINNDVLLCAAEAKISMISNPYNCFNNLVDCLLETYFKVPRFLRIKDVFGITVKDYAPDYFYTSTNPNLQTVYFKVNDLRLKHGNVIERTSGGCYIVKGVTTLLQEENIHSYLPPKLVQSIALQNDLPVHLQNVMRSLANYPPSLEKSLQSLQACVSPFLQNDRKMKIRPVFLVNGTPGSGKSKLIWLLAERNGFHLLNVDTAEIQSLSAAQTVSKLRAVMQNAANNVPCILKLSNIQIFGKNSEGQKDERIITAFATELRKLNENMSKYPVIVIATSEDDELVADMERLFIQSINIEHPDQTERAETLSWLLQTKGLKHQADLVKIAGLCSDFGLADLKALVVRVARVGYQSLRAGYRESPLTLLQNDFLKVYEQMQAAFSDRLGAPRIPKVYWEDIGGLANLKHEIKRRIELPLLNTMGLGRSGILLYGPPGTGKTLLAKAVATECQLHFMSIKGPELLNMYVGQSEKNIRQVFERARTAAPCVIFFDELDSLAPNRGFSGDSGGVMDRVVSQLLAEMDGIDSSGKIFIIGATNRPDLIDPALLRPGRFDKMLYVGIYADKDSQLNVLRAVTRHFKMSNTGNILERLLKELPANLTGADLYAVCSDAWLYAIRRILDIIDKIDDIEQKNGLLQVAYQDGVVVQLEDFINAAQNLVPSVSSEEISRYEKLKMELISR